MSRSDRSINQRLAKAKSLEAKRATAQGWAAEWQAEQAGLLHALDQAARSGDGLRAAQALGGLHAMHAKRFQALPGVLDALLAYEEDAAISQPGSPSTDAQVD